MIFSFTGAQSTGKTTLLEHLKCKNLGNHSFEFIPEVTRLVRREYEVPINEGGDDMTQMLIMTEHIRNIYKGRTDNLIRSVNKILDRCALDGIVYSHYHPKLDNFLKQRRDLGKEMSPVWRTRSVLFLLKIEQISLMFLRLLCVSPVTPKITNYTFSKI